MKRICDLCDETTTATECPACGADTVPMPAPCPECDDTLVIEVTYNSDPTGSRMIYCDRCQAGIDKNRDEAARQAAASDADWDRRMDEAREEHRR